MNEENNTTCKKQCSTEEHQRDILTTQVTLKDVAEGVFDNDSAGTDGEQTREGDYTPSPDTTDPTAPVPASGTETGCCGGVSEEEVQEEVVMINPDPDSMEHRG